MADDPMDERSEYDEPASIETDLDRAEDKLAVEAFVEETDHVWPPMSLELRNQFCPECGGQLYLVRAEEQTWINCPACDATIEEE